MSLNEQALNEWEAKAARSGIPEHMRTGVALYIVHGTPPGSFLTAVLSNDLMEAMGRADDVNLRSLPAYGRFLYNEAPSACFRSAECMKTWVTRGGLEGLPQAVAA